MLHSTGTPNSWPISSVIFRNKGVKLATGGGMCRRLPTASRASSIVVRNCVLAQLIKSCLASASACPRLKCASSKAETLTQLDQRVVHLSGQSVTLAEYRLE